MTVRVPDLDDEALHLPVVRRQGMPRGACQSPRDIHGLQGTYLREMKTKLQQRLQKRRQVVQRWAPCSGPDRGIHEGIRRGIKEAPALFQGILALANTVNSSSGWGILSDHFTLV